MFCPRCKWKLINPEDIQKFNRCPKCGTWTFEILENKYYKGKKLIGSEFALTDNDESFFEAGTYKDAKKIWEKASNLFEKFKKGGEDD